MGIFEVRGNTRIGALIISVLLAEGIGFLSGFLGGAETSFYQSINKPEFAPASWVFPVVWTILYFLMAVAAYRVWLRGKFGKNVGKGLLLYVIQLALNFAWTIIFFRFKLIVFGFVELIVLWIFILLTTLEFYKKDRIAGYLMVPYLLWVSFAGVLNYMILTLNR